MNSEGDSNNITINITENNSKDNLNTKTTENPIVEEEVKQCPICYTDVSNIDSDNLVTLKCGHQFCYDCILMEYKTVIENNNKYQKYKFRKCPFCRSDGGYLPTKPGIIPMEFIHKEFKLIKNAKDLLKYLDKSRCHAILKTGINKGCQCTKKFKDPKIPYCARHLKYFKNE